MEEIRKFVEDLIQMAGVTGGAVPVVRHILLTITAILLAMLSDLLCRRLLVPIIMKVTDKTEVTWDDVLFNKKVLTSACHIVPAVVIWSLMPLVYLEYPIFKEILERATGIYIVVMSVRTALVFIGSFKGLESSEERRSSAQQYFHTFCGVLHKGDWITVKSVDANGIVEEMSLTTVKVRNFDNTIVTISPATLVNGSFQNWIGMQKSGGRRVQRKVYFDFRSIRLVDEELRARLLEKHFATEDSFKPKESLQKMLAKAEVGNEHQTEMEKDQNAGLGNARQHEHQVLADLRNPAALAPTNLQLYRKYMEKYLRERPEVNTEMTLMVRQLEATQCGLPMEFYFFVKDKVWVNYEHILAEIMEHAYALSAEFGLKIYQQYPEQ